jgi:phthalate 4,5-dioxygenase oxygenase subunit
VLTHEENELLTRTGPGTSMGSLFRCFWVPCLLSSELPTRDCPPARVNVLGEELIAFRSSDNTVGLLDAYCAHRRAPLFFGRNEDCGLRCVYHGWKYDTEGRCVDMPNEPAGSRFKDHIKLKSYPTREAGGIVWAFMGQGEPPAMPALEWLRLPESHFHIAKVLVESNYLQALEGDHDSSHASHLHSTLDNQLDDAFRMGDTQFTAIHMKDKAPRLFTLETEYGLITASRRNATETTSFWRLVPWLMPFYSLIASEPGTSLFLNIRVPLDDERSWLYRVAYHPESPLSGKERASYRQLGSSFQDVDPATFRAVANVDNDYLVNREIQRYETFSGIESIPAQDRAVTERMAPAPGGSRAVVDRTQERLGSSDAAIVLLRRRLLGLAADCEKGIVPAAASDGDLYFLRAPAIELPKDVPFDVGSAEYLNGASWKRQGT